VTNEGDSCRRKECCCGPVLVEPVRHRLVFLKRIIAAQRVQRRIDCGSVAMPTPNQCTGPCDRCVRRQSTAVGNARPEIRTRRVQLARRSVQGRHRTMRHSTPSRPARRRTRGIDLSCAQKLKDRRRLIRRHQQAIESAASAIKWRKTKMFTPMLENPVSSRCVYHRSRRKKSCLSSAGHRL